MARCQWILLCCLRRKLSLPSCLACPQTEVWRRSLAIALVGRVNEKAGSTLNCSFTNFQHPHRQFYAVFFFEIVFCCLFISGDKSFDSRYFFCLFIYCHTHFSTFLFSCFFVSLILSLPSLTCLLLPFSYRLVCSFNTYFLLFLFFRGQYLICFACYYL